MRPLPWPGSHPMDLNKNLRYMLLRFIQAKISNPASANQEGPEARLNQISENKVYIPIGNTTYLHEVWGISRSPGTGPHAGTHTASQSRNTLSGLDIMLERFKTKSSWLPHLTISEETRPTYSANERKHIPLRFNGFENNASRRTLNLPRPP